MLSRKTLPTDAEDPSTVATAATHPLPFVPITELPGYKVENDTTHAANAAPRSPGGPRLIHDDSAFIAKQVAILDARRREGMNLIVQDDDGRIIKIAPNGTKTDVTDEVDRRVAQAGGIITPNR